VVKLVNKAILLTVNKRVLTLVLTVLGARIEDRRAGEKTVSDGAIR